MLIKLFILLSEYFPYLFFIIIEIPIQKFQIMEIFLKQFQYFSIVVNCHYDLLFVFYKDIKYISNFNFPLLSLTI